MILIRADCGVEIGSGHVMRCLALAQAWQDRSGRVVYAMATRVPGIEARLRAENIEVVTLPVRPGSAEDAAATAEAAKVHGAEWIVLDGYHFDGNYQRAIKEAGLRLMVLDDYGHAEHYWADLVLNQDTNAEEDLYCNREPATRLLLGLQYVLLRREFRQSRPPHHAIPQVARKLLVTLGGSDPPNATLKVIRALGEIGPDDLETVVLVGPANPHWADLEAAAHQRQDRLRLVRNARNVPEFMAWCDMAVTAGGSTVWELAFFAVPSIVLILAENQKHSTRLLHQQGACLVLGDSNEVSSSVLAAAISEVSRDFPGRSALSERIGALVDGRGVDRVCEMLGPKETTCGQRDACR